MKKKLTMLFGGMLLALAMSITAYASEVQTENNNTQGISLNREFEKYFDYTNEQLASEFNSKVVSHNSNQWGSETWTVYYDGEISENGYYWSKENPDSNTIIISVTENGSTIYGTTNRNVSLSLRTSRFINGVTNDSKLEDIFTLGIPDYSAELDEFQLFIEEENGKIYNSSFLGSVFIDMNTEQQFIKDIDYALMGRILDTETDSWDIIWNRALEYLRTRNIDINTYVNIIQYVNIY